MSDSSYTIRNYQPADFDRYVRSISEAERLEPTGRSISPQVIAEHLKRPNYSPEQDLFIIELEGNIVGRMNVTPEPGIKRVILACWVHPELRKNGLASGLFERALRRAGELGAGVAHVNTAADNTAAKSLLEKLGFAFVRRFLELRLDMSRVRWQDTDPPAPEIWQLRPGEEEKLTEIQNRAFAGTWGYNPNTVEMVTYCLNLNNGSPEDVVITCDGDKVIGYCWTQVTETEGIGRIFMIGTDPDCRGRGVAKRMLLAGLAYLKSKGLRFADLTVDSENTPACALYWSLGFEIRASSLWYEKVLT